MASPPHVAQKGVDDGYVDVYRPVVGGAEEYHPATISVLRVSTPTTLSGTLGPKNTLRSDRKAAIMTTTTA